MLPPLGISGLAFYGRSESAFTGIPSALTRPDLYVSSKRTSCWIRYGSPVTETRGPLQGHRVVRGREGDCIAHYANAGALTP